MSHDHPHDHDEDEGPPSEHEIMSRAMQELLEEKGILTAAQVRRRMELFEQEFPQRGSRVIAHALGRSCVQEAAAGRRQGGVRRNGR